MTQIVPFSRTSTTNRGTEKVNVWLKTNERMKLEPSGNFIVSGQAGLLSEISNMLQMAKQTVVITATRIDSTLSKEIVDAGKNGVRVYLLLTSEGFDEWLKNDFKDIADNVLCRRTSQGIPSLILIDGETPDSDGILMQSGTAVDRSLKVEGAAWGLRLNQEQASQLAHYASWLFWSSNGPRSETRCSNHLKSPQDVKPLSASLSKVSSNSVIDFNAKSDGNKFFIGIKDIQRFTAIGFSSFDLKEIGGLEIDRRLQTAVLTSPGDVRSGEASADSNASKIVALISADGSRGWLFDWVADAKMQLDHQTVLSLDDKQAGTLLTVVNKSKDKTEWNLMNNVNLSSLEVGAEALLTDGKTKAQILENQTIDLGKQTVTPWSKERLSEFEPHANSRPDCEPLAKVINWTWENIPPCPPKDAKDDLIERQFSEAVRKAKAADEYIRERLSTHGKKGEKELRKLEKIAKNTPQDIRLISDLKTWFDALSDVNNQLKKLEDGGDSDIQRKKKTKNVEIPDTPAENRPSVGRLFMHGKVKFLAIDLWTDYEEGLAESEKYNAELCATLEVLKRQAK
jgi:hypothetical protein